MYNFVFITIHFSIYEPSLEIDIDETSEIEVLKEAQLLCDRINEIEKSVGPKELTTIPLPKPLEDFTWLSLGKTIIEVHKYITNNNMVFIEFKGNIHICNLHF